MHIPLQDLEHLKDFTMWLRNEGPGNTGRHNPIRSYFYWCYNAVRTRGQRRTVKRCTMTGLGTCLLCGRLDGRPS